MVAGWGGGDYGEKQEEVALVRRLMGSAGECRRAVLGEYLDGGERQECHEEEERCDQCGDEREEREGGALEAGEEREGREKRVMAIQRQQQEIGRRRGQERMQQERLELEELEQQLQRARGKCASCVEFGIKPDNPSLFWCREESSEQFRRDYAETKEAIRQGRMMEAYSGCMECFLPQAWCNQWEQSEQEGGMYRRQVGEKCRFTDVVLSGVVVGLGRKEMVEEMQGRMAAAGFDMSQETEALKYMGRRRRWGGLEASELLREFYLIRRGR